VIRNILTGDFYNCNFWVVVNFYPPTHYVVALLQDRPLNTMTGHL